MQEEMRSYQGPYPVLPARWWNEEALATSTLSRSRDSLKPSHKSGLPQATFCVLGYVSKHWSPPMYLPYLLPLYAEAQEVPSCFAVALKLRCPDTRCALCCLIWHCQALLPTCCTHTHTHSPAKLLIKCDWSTFKCLYWPALTLINVSKKSEVPAHWRWSLASDKWFLMLYHILFGSTPSASISVASGKSRAAPAPSSRTWATGLFWKIRNERTWSESIERKAECC